MLLNELLARSLEQGHTYALCRCGEDQTELQSALRQLGFTQAADGIYYVDMRNPVMLLQDAMLCIKPPHRDAPAVREAVLQTRPRLRMALSAMFPGKLASVLRHGMLNQAIAQRIERMNGVQDVPEGVWQPGNGICACPTGKFLRTPSCPIRSRRRSTWKNATRPTCAASRSRNTRIILRCRDRSARCARSTGPIILVDDLLHKGYRIEKAFDRVFRQEQLAVDRIVVAVMSAMARSDARAGQAG